MITPVFTVTQTATHVIVTMCCPHLKVNKCDMSIDGDTFRMTASPYFLRLVFPQLLREDQSETASYDPQTSMLVANLPKLVCAPRAYHLNTTRAHSQVPMLVLLWLVGWLVGFERNRSKANTLTIWTC
jgi:hypothetical protein